MVEADGHPLTELIEDIVMWPFRLARLAAKALKSKVMTCEPAPARLPKTHVERAVLAALILAGEPVNNRTLAALMDCSPGESSKRLTLVGQRVRKQRVGREVFISLN